MPTDSYQVLSPCVRAHDERRSSLALSDDHLAPRYVRVSASALDSPPDEGRRSMSDVLRESLLRDEKKTDEDLENFGKKGGEEGFLVDHGVGRGKKEDDRKGKDGDPDHYPLRNILVKEEESILQATKCFIHTLWTIVVLSVPIFFSSLSWIAIKTTDIALIGHTGTENLAAASLADFWTACSGVFLYSRVITNLCSQAYGAGNTRLVGTWLQVLNFFKVWF